MKIIKMLSYLLIILLLFSGCSQTKINEVEEDKRDLESKVFIVEDENFRVKTYISKLEFREKEEIDIYSTIEYIGKNGSVSIWSGEPFFHHLIYDGQDYINQDGTLSILKETVLKKGEIYTIPFSKNAGYSEDDPKAPFWKEYLSEKELRLPRGNYTFIGRTAFFLDDDLKEKVVALETKFDVRVVSALLNEELPKNPHMRGEVISVNGEDKSLNVEGKIEEGTL